MRRKKIAVVSAENESVYQNNTIRGINAQAAALGCEVLIFTTFMRTTYVPEYRLGEINIYNLINYDDIDGVIVLYLPLEQDQLLDDVIPGIRAKAKCPVVCLDNFRASDDFYTAQVFADDAEGMEEITDHVIDVHGCRKVYCITGPENDTGAMKRLGGFVRSMKKHGLTVDKDKIFHGEFWYDNGEAVAKKIISGEIEKPDAIVCAADHIAAGAVNLLIANGFKIPEDIIVTGYDGSDIAFNNKTMLTSVVPTVMKKGAESLSVLWELITGEKCENVLKDVRPRVVCGQTCGCEVSDYYTGQRTANTYIANHNFSIRPKTDMSILDKSFMPEKLTASKGINDCYERIGSFTYLINDYRFFILFTCDGWDDPSSDKDYLTSGYSPKVKIAIHNTCYDFLKQHPELIGPKGWCIYDDYDYNVIDSKQMAPDLDGRYDQPFAWYFTPLHFEERCLGYTVLVTTLDQPPFDHIYRNWTRNVTNALEMQRIRNILTQSSNRDSMTGLYNRRGLDKYIADNTPTKEGSMLFYLIADMDRLKYINDTFGHIEGDNGITIVSSAVVACTGYSEICARTGGDEFAIVGFGSYTEEELATRIGKFKAFIDKYNETSGKPYKVSASIGYYCRPFSPGDSIAAAAEYADKVMYKNKIAAKKNRTD